MKLDPVAFLETKLFLGHACYGLVYFNSVDEDLYENAKWVISSLLRGATLSSVSMGIPYLMSEAI